MQPPPGVCDPCFDPPFDPPPPSLVPSLCSDHLEREWPATPEEYEIIEEIGHGAYA